MKMFMDGPPPIPGRYREHANHAINLLNVISFIRSKYSWYPDNDGVPSIAFRMIGKEESLQWIFRSEQDRDAKYDELLSYSAPGK